MSGNPESVALALQSNFIKQHPRQAARSLESLPVEQVVDVLSSHPVPIVIPLLEQFTTENAVTYLRDIDKSLLKKFLTELAPNFCAAVLSQCEDQERENWLGLLSKPVRSELERIMAYPENTAGRLMDSRIGTFRGDMTVQESIERLRGLKTRPSRNLFLVDEEHRLTGRVEYQDLILADSQSLLKNVARPIQTVVDTLVPREEVVETLEKHKLENLPVIDISGRLIGVIRHDILIQAVEEEATVDLLTMVGAGGDERALSKVSLAVKKRQPWLQINLVTAFLAAAVVGFFEDLIAQFTALAVLLPVVAGQSGNAGSQALAVTMRGLALREITVRQWLPVALKEVQVGAVNGIGICMTTCLGVYVWSHSVGLTLVIGISMIISMVLAGLAGALVPVVLTRVGQDPATASSIILTTVTDVAGFFSFLGTATFLSKYL